MSYIPSTELDASTPVVVLASSQVGHGIARTLGRLGIPVYGVHADPKVPTARSRYWHDAIRWDLVGASPDETVDLLLSLARGIGHRPILLPTDDYGCLFVADHARRLDGAYRFPQPPAGLTRRLSNKRDLNALCRQYGVPTPPTDILRSRSDVERYARAGKFPVVLKGADTWATRRRAGRPMVTVHRPDDLLAWYEVMETPEDPSLILQEHIAAEPGSVWMYNGYFDVQSHSLVGMTGQKMRQYPRDFGATSFGICVPNEVVKRQTEDFLSVLGYRGIVDADYVHDPRTGQYLLLDVNPMVGSTFRLFVDSCGMDVVRALYLDLTGQEVGRIGHCAGRTWLAESNDLLAAIGRVRAGGLKPLDWLRSLRDVDEVSWWARDDPRPALLMWGYSILTLASRAGRARSFSAPLQNGKSTSSSIDSHRYPAGRARH